MNSCQIKRCTQPAPWRLDCTDHPNGGFVGWYCTDHLRPPMWDDATSVYTITISGPHTQAV